MPRLRQKRQRSVACPVHSATLEVPPRRYHTTGGLVRAKRATRAYLVLTHKAFRYRVYPTPAQEARLIAWEASLRWLWNLANEHRLLGLAMSKKRYPSAFDQINGLKDLRSEAPWLADVPRDVCAQLLGSVLI